MRTSAEMLGLLVVRADWGMLSMSPVKIMLLPWVVMRMTSEVLLILSNVGLFAGGQSMVADV